MKLNDEVKPDVDELQKTVPQSRVSRSTLAMHNERGPDRGAPSYVSIPPTPYSGSGKSELKMSIGDSPRAVRLALPDLQVAALVGHRVRCRAPSKPR